MNFSEKNKAANIKAADYVINAEPYWIDVMSAGEFLEGMDKNTVLHSGPPISYERMCGLHKNGMKNAMLLEGLADDEKSAEKLLLSGEIKVKSALDFNTVGSGTGIITSSTPLLIVEDRMTKKRAGVFPSEGKFGGGFCGWGLYSKEIAENLAYMRDKLFKPLIDVLSDEGGFPLKPIITQSIMMGDENHSSQTASDSLFIRSIIPYALKASNSEEILMYFANTPRFFHNFGQAFAKSSLIEAENTEFSSMVTAAGGNGVEYGIKVSGLGNEWFTAPSPMIKGRYMTEGAKRENQLPWIGDSSIVECVGLGGIISAASPEVCSWRGDTVEDGVKTTRMMETISVSKNKSYKIPALDFDNPPVGIDIIRTAKSGILPVIDGGMISSDGGWMGAGCAKIPQECFEKAYAAYIKKYGIL